MDRTVDNRLEGLWRKRLIHRDLTGYPPSYPPEFRYWSGFVCIGSFKMGPPTGHILGFSQPGADQVISV